MYFAEKFLDVKAVVSAFNQDKVLVRRGHLRDCELLCGPSFQALPTLTIVDKHDARRLPSGLPADGGQRAVR